MLAVGPGALGVEEGWEADLSRVSPDVPWEEAVLVGERDVFRSEEGCGPDGPPDGPDGSLVGLLLGWGGLEELLVCSSDPCGVPPDCPL